MGPETEKIKKKETNQTKRVEGGAPTSTRHPKEQSNLRCVDRRSNSKTKDKRSEGKGESAPYPVRFKGNGHPRGTRMQEPWGRG